METQAQPLPVPARGSWLRHRQRDLVIRGVPARASLPGRAAERWLEPTAVLGARGQPSPPMASVSGGSAGDAPWGDSKIPPVASAAAPRAHGDPCGCPEGAWAQHPARVVATPEDHWHRYLCKMLGEGSSSLSLRLSQGRTFPHRRSGTYRQQARGSSSSSSVRGSRERSVCAQQLTQRLSLSFKRIHVLLSGRWVSGTKPKDFSYFYFCKL